MTEIIIAILIQLSTILGGVPEDQKTKDSSDKLKDKTEKSIQGSGGTGNWGDT